MIQKAIIVVLAFFLFACNAEKAGNRNDATEAEAPDIQITVEGMPTGQAYLIGVFADQQFRVDSAIVDGSGQLHFKRPTPYDEGFYFVFFPDQSMLQLLIDKDQTFDLTTSAGNFVEATTVAGNLDNELLYENLQFEARHQQKLMAVTQQLQGLTPDQPEYKTLKAEQEQILSDRRVELAKVFKAHPNALFSTFKKAGQNPMVWDVRHPDGTVNNELQVYLYRTAFWDGVDFSDERLLHTPVITNKLKRYITELTPQHPDSIIKATDFLVEKILDYPEYYQFITNWIALNYEPQKTTLMDREAIYVHMIKNYFTYDRSFWADSAQIYSLQLRADEMAASLVGKKGPNVEAKDPNGQVRSIAEIKSPYVIVFLYNPECEHCIEETPKLVKFYNEWKAKGVEIYAIALDTNDQQWKDFISKNNMNWINVFDPTNRSIYGKYYVDNTPEIYVLDPNRTIIAKNLKVEQLPEVLPL